MSDTEITDDDIRGFHLRNAVNKAYTNNSVDPTIFKTIAKHSIDTGVNQEDVLAEYVAHQVLQNYKLEENNEFWSKAAYAQKKNDTVAHLEYKADVTDQLENVQKCKDAGFFDDKREDTIWKACEGRVVASIPLEVMTYIKHYYGLDQSDPDFMKQIRRIAYFHDDRVIRACLVNDF